MRHGHVKTYMYIYIYIYDTQSPHQKHCAASYIHPSWSRLEDTFWRMLEDGMKRPRVSLLLPAFYQCGVTVFRTHLLLSSQPFSVDTAGDRFLPRPLNPKMK